ncbi:ZFP26-like protein [Mya arenaria]|uniref:ZFP26-like protein n=1 Tax=Mya arenaria TaxID=6604 RepID=A0ABY7ESB3_MYAAR|nr:ZFP26-like protein [Mya arenaria]
MEKTKSKSLYPFVCGICSEKYKSLAKYHAHIQGHGIVEELDSDNEGSETDKAVENERSTSKKSSSDSFKCGICMEDFSSMTLLHNHMVNEEKITSYNYSDTDHIARASILETGIDISPKPRGRGRPRKIKNEIPSSPKEDTIQQQTEIAVEAVDEKSPAKRGRGRPPKRLIDDDNTRITKLQKRDAEITAEESADMDEEIEEQVEQDGKGSMIKRGRRGRPRKSSKVEDLDDDYVPEQVEIYSSPRNKKKIIADDHEPPRKRHGVVAIKKDLLQESGNESAGEDRGTRRSSSRREVKLVDYKALAGLGSPSRVKSNAEKEKSTSRLKSEYSDKGTGMEVDTNERKEKKSKTQKIPVVALKKIDKVKTSDLEKEQKSTADGMKDIKNKKKKSEVKNDSEVSKNSQKLGLVDLGNVEIEEVNNDELAAEAFMDFVDIDTDNTDDKTEQKLSKKDKFKLSNVIKNKYFKGKVLTRKNMLYTCNICSRLVPYKGLKRHKLSHVKGRLEPKCKICKKFYKSRFHLEDHMRSVHSRTKYLCPKCSKKFASKQAIEQHIARHILLRHIPETSLEDVPYEVLKASPQTSEDDRKYDNDDSEGADYKVKTDAKDEISFVEFVDEYGNTVMSRETKTEDIDKIQIEAIERVDENGKPVYLFGSEDGIFEMVKNKDVVKKWKENKLSDPSTDKKYIKSIETDFMEEELASVSEKRLLHPNTCSMCLKAFMNKEACDRHVRRFHHNRIYFCTLCRKELVRKEYFHDHMKMHIRRCELQESEVDFEATVNRLEVHLFKEPKDDEEVIPLSRRKNTYCFFCKKEYHIRDKYTQHMRKVHNPRVHYCELCKKHMRKKDAFKKHMEGHIRNNEIAREDIDFNRTIRILNAKLENSVYVSAENGKPIDGDDDFDELAEAAELQDEDMAGVDEKVNVKKTITVKVEPEAHHVNVSLNEESETGRCSRCPFRCSSKEELDQHLVKHDPLKNLTCKDCNFVHESPESMLAHKCPSRKENVPQQCTICEAYYTSKRAYRKHRVKHLMRNDEYHSKETVEKLQTEMAQEYKEKLIQMPKVEFTSRQEYWTSCEICGKKVNRKRLKRHKEIHRDSLDFECEVCSKRFKSLRYLKDHKMKTHDKQADQICNICGNMYKGTKYLEIHMQTHGPKDKICPKCGKGFTTALYLRVHMQTHLGRKSFKCQKCEAAFSHRARLVIHQVEVHGLKPGSKCKYCFEEFPSRQKARIHERRVHEGYIPQGKKKKRLVMGNKKQPKYVVGKRRTTGAPTVVQTKGHVTATNGDHHYQSEDIGTRIITEDGEEIQLVIEHHDQDSELVQYVEADSDGEQQKYVVQTTEDGSQTELGSPTQQVLEIPEDAQQCQIILYPDGTFKLLNVMDQEKESSS